MLHQSLNTVMAKCFENQRSSSWLLSRLENRDTQLFDISKHNFKNYFLPFFHLQLYFMVYYPGKKKTKISQGSKMR